MLYIISFYSTRTVTHLAQQALVCYAFVCSLVLLVCLALCLLALIMVYSVAYCTLNILLQATDGVTVMYLFAQ